MINYIKDKLFKNSMKKFSVFILFVLCLLSSTYANAQHEILQYHFEEGSGGVILDTSGFDNHGTRSGGRWRTDAHVFGTYGFDFDGGNDYITSMTTSNIPDKMSVSFWIKSTSTAEDVIFTMYDTTDEIIIYIDRDAGTDNLKLQYIDNNLIERSIDIDSNNFIGNQYYHIVLSFDFLNNSIDYYRNGVKNVITYTDTINRESNVNVLRLGADQDENGDLDGQIDEFRIFDFLTNQSQVLSLYNDNIITLSEEELPEILTQKRNIIKNTTPLYNSSINNPIHFSIELYHKADCELYVDNVLIQTFSNQLAYTYNTILPVANNTKYFVYCEYIDSNNTLNYELKDTTHFNVLDSIPQNVNFLINGIDFNVNDYNLWITTPCLNKGLKSLGLQPYRTEYNPNGAYFQKIKNGATTFNLSLGTYDFCLYNANFIVNDYGKTNNYDVVSFGGMIELGELDVPNNRSTSFTISVEQFDIFEKTNPKAWGQTWSSIVVGLLLGLLGLIVLIGGLASGNGKIVFVGAILILSAFGIEFTAFVGAIL